jgi:MFS family permease
MFWTLGSVVEASLAWAVLPSLGWRWLLAISALPLAVLLIAYPLLPESPRFLLGVNGDAVGARKVLEVCLILLCGIENGRFIHICLSFLLDLLECNAMRRRFLAGVNRDAVKVRNALKVRT